MTNCFGPQAACPVHRTLTKMVLKNNILVGGISLGSRKVALKLRSLIMKGEDISGVKQSLFDE